MSDFPIPVRAIGPGSQPEDPAALAVLDIPREVATFQMPRVPEKASAGVLAAARDLLAQLCDEFGAWLAAPSGRAPQLEMTSLAPAVRDLLGELVGEGEVSIRIDDATPRLHIQECAFTGLWRCGELDAAGRLQRDWIEAAGLPQGVLAAAHAGAACGVPPVDAPPGTMNAPALLAEVAHQLHTRTPGAAAHAINLTLLPLAPADHAMLERALPIGPVAMISRGFGNCRISSTGTRDVWRVQYFNSMNTLILNKIEVVEVPEVALAAADDLADSRERLAELVAWLDESIAEAQ
jgi:hydrogenase-1 operon protein HyaF